MSGSWSAGGERLEYTPGDFAGDGAFTVAILTNPAGSTHGMAEWYSGGVEQAVFLQFAWHLYGKADFSDGFGTYGPPSPGWMVYAISKAAGSNLYRFHSWPYAANESGVMTHGFSTGAGNHGDFLTADSIRIGHGAAAGEGLISVVAMWDRALSDAELDTLVSASLADWDSLSPDFGVELSDWNGTTGDNVWAGSSTFVGETGAVAVGANPTGFDFDLTPPPANEPPTVNAGADQDVDGGDLVTVTATANDVDGTIDSYAWVRISGPAVTLAGTGAGRTFTAPDVDGTVVLRVTVTDDDGATAQDTVSINITASIPPPDPIGINPAELRINRKNTLAFIAADPIAMVLTPHTLTRQPGGGRKQVAGTPRTEQVFRLIPQTDVQPSVQTPDGTQLTPTFVLLGAHNCEMGRWDTFTYKGIDYQIVSTVRPAHSDNAYERKADVAVI